MHAAVVAEFDEEASQTRDYCVAKYATQRAARPDPSLRNERLLGMTIPSAAKAGHGCSSGGTAEAVPFHESR
jgi:hypothetical protein